MSAPSGQTRWVGAAEAFPDTLIRDNITQLYSRTLRHGIKIVYDAAGRHIQTINCTGDTTFIAYNGNGSISTIRVPPSGQAGTTYSFAYNPTTALLQSITDPAGRVLTATMTAGRLTSLTDPDLVSTSFGYDLFSHMTSRTSRRGAATRYTFTNNRLTQFAIPFRASPADSGITTIRPWEFVGLDGAPVDLPDSGYTRVDGPRTESADVAKFWVDQWRAPTQVVGPNGDTLHVSRGSVATPALVTRVVRPDGTVDTLLYNARGNLKEQRTITDGLPGAVPMTITRWGYGAATAPDSPDTLVDSTAHLKTLYGYNQWGLTSLVTAPNGHQTRFDYVTNPASPLLGELQGVAELSVAVWDSTTRTKVTAAELRTGFAFNQLGNVVADTSPMKRVTRYTLDAMQRVQQLFDPANHRTEYFYDAIDRVDSLAEHVEDSDPSYQHPIVTHYRRRTTRRLCRRDRSTRNVGAQREAIELKCVDAEIQFAARVPGSEGAIEKTRSLLRTRWWEAQDHRETMSVELSNRGIPRWLARFPASQAWESPEILGQVHTEAPTMRCYMMRVRLSPTARLRALEAENRRRKRVVADQALNIQVLTDVLGNER